MGHQKKRQSWRDALRKARTPLRGAGALLLVGGMTLGTVACDDDEDPSGPGDESGPVEAVVQDDPGAASPSLAPSVGGLALSLQAATFSGTMTGDFQAAISADGTTWVDLGSLNGITVDLQDAGATTIHGQQTVEANTYSRVRLTIQTGQVTLDAGSTIGGVDLTTDLTLTLNGGSEVVVERQVTPFTVSADGTAMVLFELNSESWIDQTAVTAGTVAEADLDAAITAAAQAGAG